MIDIDREMSWVTFSHDGWETKWHPVLDTEGNHMPFDEVDTMELCRSRFNVADNWVSFGIAPTSQMIVNNSVRDNL